MNFAKEITGLPGLIKTSAQQLRRVPALTGTAMLTALNVVVGTLFIPITPTLRIGFSSIPAAVCGMMYGPVCTGFAGVIAAVLPKDMTADYVEYMTPYMGKENIYVMQIRQTGAVHMDF